MAVFWTLLGRRRLAETSQMLMVQVPVMGGRAIRDDGREGRLCWGQDNEI